MNAVNARHAATKKALVGFNNHNVSAIIDVEVDEAGNEIVETVSGRTPLQLNIMFYYLTE